MHPSDRAEGPLTPGLVFEMLQAHQRTAALKAAIDLDLAPDLGEPAHDRDGMRLSRARRALAIPARFADLQPWSRATTPRRALMRVYHEKVS